MLPTTLEVVRMLPATLEVLACCQGCSHAASYIRRAANYIRGARMLPVQGAPMLPATLEGVRMLPATLEALTCCQLH